MCEAKGVDLSSVGFASGNRFGYYNVDTGWDYPANVYAIMIYNKSLTEAESLTNYTYFAGKYGI